MKINTRPNTIILFCQVIIAVSAVRNYALRHTSRGWVAGWVSGVGLTSFGGPALDALGSIARRSLTAERFRAVLVQMSEFRSRLAHFHVLVSNFVKFVREIATQI